MTTFTMDEEYWEAFQLQEEDTEFLYNYLLEKEMPLTSQELVSALIDERIRRQKVLLEKQRTSGGDLYQPKGHFSVSQRLIFPALNWKHGEVKAIRPGVNPELGEFQVVRVMFEDGSEREFASGLAEHKLNAPPQIAEEVSHLDKATILKLYQEDLILSLEEALESNPDFVRIAGRWFPRALLVDINIGHLNLAEAVLDMAGGGPMPTKDLMEQIGLSTYANPKVVEFSLDLALQQDGRFDEVGPAGDVLWYLRRLEPADVLEPPLYLRYQGLEYDRSKLTKEMLALEKELDDELSPLNEKYTQLEGEIRLIFPHWRAGTLPLGLRVRHLFPTAYESPRIRFTLVDGDTGNSFPGWVVREKRYVAGLSEWYESKGVMPGSIIKVCKGERPGEVIIRTETRRPIREWVRTVLVGSDGGIVFAMLKQNIATPFDERMVIAIPDKEGLDHAWAQLAKHPVPFERLVINTIRDLAKLNPQGHVHATELYATINVTYRCPPGPILATLASRPEITLVGDLHYRLRDVDFE